MEKQIEKQFISEYKDLSEKDKKIYVKAFWEAVDFILKLEVQGIERKNERSTRNKKPD